MHYFLVRFVSFFIFTTSLNIEMVHGYQTIQTISVDPFEQNMQAILQGNNKAEIWFGEEQDLNIKIHQRYNLGRKYYSIEFNAFNSYGMENNGIDLDVFPTQENSYLGYVKSLARISNKFSGTKLLKYLAAFCKQMQLKKVLLEDLSEIENDEGSFSLQKFHILTSDDYTSWYESNGYNPVSKQTFLDRIQFIIKVDITSLHYFDPIPSTCYRYAAESFAHLHYKDYLWALKEINKSTGLYIKELKNLQRTFKKVAISDSSTFGEILKELRVCAPELQPKLMEHFQPSYEEEDGKAIAKQFFEWICGHREQTSSKVNYAMIIKLQTIFRQSYNFQTKDERSELLKHIALCMQGESEFNFTRDLSSILLEDDDDDDYEDDYYDDYSDDDAENPGFNDDDDEEEDDDDDAYYDSESDDDDDEDKEFITMCLRYLADTPIQLFFEYSSDDSQQRLAKILHRILADISPEQTVADITQMLESEEKNKFMQELLFGTFSSESYYPFVCSFAEKLKSSKDAQEFFVGHLLNHVILDDSVFMEQDF